MSVLIILDTFSESFFNLTLKLIKSKNYLKIDGDLTEKDLPSISMLMKKKALNATSDYEYNRLFRN